MKYYWMCWSLLWSSFVVAQEQDTLTYAYTIYFETDRHVPTNNQLNGLTNFLEEHTFNGTLQAITIVGHTDKRASVAYNLALSKRRATAIEAYLAQYYQEKKIKLPVVDVAFYGEEQPSMALAQEGQHAQNRRVIIQWIYKQPVPPISPPDPVIAPTPEVVEEPFVPIEEEHPVVLNVRDYLFFMPSQTDADEAEVEVIKTGREAYDAGVTTVTTEGRLLNSYGMLHICANPDLEFIKVRVPVLDTTAPAPNYYNRVRDRWGIVERPITKILDEDSGQWYYELEVENCKWTNLDTSMAELGMIIRMPITPFWVKKMHILNDNPIQNHPLRARGLRVHAAAGMAPAGNFIEEDSSSSKIVMVEMVGQPSSQTRVVEYMRLVGKGKRVVFPMKELKKKEYNRLLDNGHDGYVRVSRVGSLFVKTYPLAHVIYRIRGKDLRQARKQLRQQLKEEKR